MRYPFHRVFFYGVGEGGGGVYSLLPMQLCEIFVYAELI